MNKLIILTLVILIFPLTSLAEGVKYTCPMHPQIISDHEGTCPICGMDLVPMESHEEHTNHNEDNGSMDMEEKPTIKVSSAIIQNTGIRTDKVSNNQFGKDIRSFGVVEDNERLSIDISSRVEGWVEEIKITAVGDEVKKGDLLFKLYSPETVSAQKDYLSAFSSGFKGRITSSEKRLKALGLQNQVITQIRKSGKSIEQIPFYAQSDGIVSRINVKKGSYVKSGYNIATIQSYSSVWINASVAEKDMEFISKETKADVTFPNIADSRDEASIDYIHPTIDPKSRTGKIRLILENKEGNLRPGAYADITFRTDAKERLAVPSEAVLISSEGNYVVVRKGTEKFAPRKVETGVISKGNTEILSGLHEGEEIVVSGQFMIDSESSLREAVMKMKSDGNSSPEPVGGAHANH